MGLLDLLRGNHPAITGLPLPQTFGISSPNSGDFAAQLIYADYFQGELVPVVRATAMQIPAVARARSILVGVIAGLPLRNYDGTTGAEVDLPWFYRTSQPVPPWHRMAWTIDDLLFHGASLWAVARDSAGQITDATRVPYENWQVDQNSGAIMVNQQPVDSSEVIYIPGPFEGILAAGQPTLNGARAIDRAWVGRVQNPIPLIELHQITDDELTPDEQTAVVDAWAAARVSPTGAVGFTDNRLEIRVHGTAVTDLFIEGRNATVLDIGRLTTIPSSLLDGSMSTASLTYSTSEGKRSELLDFSINYWTAPIEARLSMDDVTPAGTRVRFDKAELILVPNPATAAPTKD